jgi:pimeloyl-ACP methyl ester carboxylesterase
MSAPPPKADPVEVRKVVTLVFADVTGYPTRSYTMPGSADAAVALLDQIGVTEAAVFGWSLGGHIGIGNELLRVLDGRWRTR